MFLEIAGYGLAQSGSHWMEIGEKLFFGSVGIAIGGIFLVMFTLLGFAAIVFFSFMRGLKYRSVPKTVGAFFRWSGMLLGMVLSILFIPLAILLKATLFWYLIGSVLLILIGYFVGRTMSKLVGFKIRRYAYFIHAFDNLRGKILRVFYVFS